MKNYKYSVPLISPMLDSFTKDRIQSELEILALTADSEVFALEDIMGLDDKPRTPAWQILFHGDRRGYDVTLSCTRDMRFEVSAEGGIYGYLRTLVTPDLELALERMREYFSYIADNIVPEEIMPPVYFADKKALSEIEQKLKAAVERENLFITPKQEGQIVIDQREPGKTHRDWFWKITGLPDYKHVRIYLSAAVFLEGKKFAMNAWTPDSVFSEWNYLNAVYADELETILEAISLYAGFARQQAIPKEHHHVPEWGKWTELLPQEYRRKTIKKFEMLLPLEQIVVAECITNEQKELQVRYCNDNANLSEEVTIRNSEITNARTFEHLAHAGPDVPAEEAVESINNMLAGRFIELPGSPYLNIKKLERKLKELPCWQDQLKAIYDGSGFY